LGWWLAGIFVLPDTKLKKRLFSEGAVSVKMVAASVNLPVFVRMIFKQKPKTVDL